MKQLTLALAVVALGVAGATAVGDGERCAIRDLP
jgi:hypothetical protein